MQITNITGATAISGGSTINDNGSTIIEKGVCWSTNQNPTIVGNKTTNGIGSDDFISNITLLTAETTYYVRAYATNSVGTSYGSQLSFTTLSNCGTVTDYDGNIYNTITIGNQCWMMENIKVTHYPNGTLIPYVDSNDVWDNLPDDSISDAMCFLNNNANDEADIYGGLYTWAAAIGGNGISSSSNPSGVQGICPDGWHIPSPDEWSELSSYLGGNSVAGGKMKVSGTTYWDSPNTGADNSSGFSAIACGVRSPYNGNFGPAGHTCYWWTSSGSGDSAPYYLVWSSSSGISVSNEHTSMGNSVRCVKD